MQVRLRIGARHPIDLQEEILHTRVAALATIDADPGIARKVLIAVGCMNAEDLPVISQAVAIGIHGVRIGAERPLQAVRQTIAIGVRARQSVAIESHPIHVL